SIPAAASRAIHSFPTRRSSDLAVVLDPIGLNFGPIATVKVVLEGLHHLHDLLDAGLLVERLEVAETVLAGRRIHRDPDHGRLAIDRKSTRLNSSHQISSYAVFC